MKIIIAQLPVDPWNPGRNLGRAAALLRRHQPWEPEVIILPENFITGPLNMQGLGGVRLAEARAAWGDFLALSRAYPRCFLVTSSPGLEEAPPGGRATGLVIQNGQIRLTRPARNAAPPASIEIQPGRRLTLLAASDRSRPGRPDGAELAVRLASEFYQGPPAPGPALTPAPEPGSWFCWVNTCGGQGSRVFTGGSYLLNPDGRTAARAPCFQPAEMRLDLDWAGGTGEPPPAPMEAMEVLRLALTTGLRDYVNGAGFSQVVLGLSGGLDSALCAVLAAQALGPENVWGLALPSPYNAPESAALAARLAENLGLAFGRIPISGLLSQTLKELSPHLAPNPSEPAVSLMAENIQARLRALLLMALANQGRRLLLCTTNKSETAMGYGTLYGDLSGALAPLGDVYKSRAYELARHLNRNGPLIPERIITKAPSAELRPNQTDQDFLPPYPLLDDILYRLVELGQNAEEAAAGSPFRHQEGFRKTVDFVIRQRDKTAFKTLQIPPCLIASPSPFKIH